MQEELWPGHLSHQRQSFPAKKFRSGLHQNFGLSALSLGVSIRSLRLVRHLGTKVIRKSAFPALNIGSANCLGLDLHHNPEFTSCEFYHAFADIEKLIHITESILSSIHQHVKAQAQSQPIPQRALKIDFKPPYPRIDFIPSLESAMKYKFPDLTAPDALETLIKVASRQGMDISPQATLPKLLDQLSARYLEPRCVDPTFIINHPECLSPLSKSFRHPTLDQIVAARAELFVNGQEVINTYEEENSPFEQRRKFLEQMSRDAGRVNASIDEDYIEALEWGLPPTGGWGAGIDRLCMLMMGVNRIGDVLSFGTLRNVVVTNRKMF